MRAKMIRVVPFCATVLFPLAVLADSSDGGTGDSRLVNAIWSVSPLLLFAITIFFFMRRAQKSPNALKYQEHMARSTQHMERVEALLERLVKATEDKNADQGKH